MKKYYFFKTVSVVTTKAEEKLKVNPLPGQTMDDGTKIDEKKYVLCSTSLRSAYPSNTVFYSTAINLSSSGKFYSGAKSFSRLTEKSDKEALEQYKALTGTEFVDTFKKSSLFEQISLDPSLSAPTSKKDGFYVTDEVWKLLVRNIKRHVNTLLTSASGNGKTSLVRILSSRLGIKLYTFDMGAIIDPISSLLGVHRLEDGHSVFDMAKFTQAIQEPCIILLDELNRASVGSNNVLFSCLDDRRELNIEIAGSKDKRSIKVHPEVTFIATANIGSEYTGTLNLDRALVDRFFPIELGQIPSAEESNVLVNRTGITKDNADLIVKIANNVRDLSRKQEISTSLSIRETLMVSSLVSDGFDLGKAMSLVYLPLYEGTKTEGERSTVNKIILSY